MIRYMMIDIYDKNGFRDHNAVVTADEAEVHFEKMTDGDRGIGLSRPRSLPQT